MAKPHQVFVGCPFSNPIRKNYDRLKREIERETPLHVVLADTTAVSSTDYLLEHITTLIRESAACIFDVTGGNPNVSLEVGIAHALPADFILAFYTRKRRSAAEKALDKLGETKPIISDLQGRNRIEYKQYGPLKEQLLKRYLSRMPYMERWRRFKKSHSSYERFALQIFEEVRDSGRTLNSRVSATLAGSGITSTDFGKALTKERLLTVKRGRQGGWYYPTR